MATNEVSTKHPHEPERAPVFDDEGRCLVCGCEYRDQQIAALTAELAALQPITGYVGLDVLNSQTYPEQGTHVVVTPDVDDATDFIVTGRAVGDPFPIYRRSHGRKDESVE